MPGGAARDDHPEMLPPTVETLLGLDTDAWASLLGLLRSVLAGLEPADPAVEWLRDTPTSRLVSGAGRRRMAAAIAEGGPVWDGIRARLVDLDPLPGDLAVLVEPTGVASASPAPADEVAGERRLRDRLRRTREERDAWRRRAEGEQARAQAIERRLTAAEADTAELRTELAEVRTALEQAAQELDRSVQREQRRHEARMGALQDELGVLRRAEHEHLQELAELRRELRGRAEDKPVREAGAAGREPARDGGAPTGPPTFVPGRPSRLPAGVEPQTTEAARLLLHAGRLVLVDGYNVTLQHRRHLDLDAQRVWLVQLLGTLAAQRRIRAVIVFDGERGGTATGSAGRGVTTRFTPDGITADDEIVLAVEGTDDPVVVVTDDQELARRVWAVGADVIATRTLLGVAA